MIATQKTLFDFKPIERKVIDREIQIKCPYEKDGLSHVYRSDAKCIVDSFGTFYDGTSLTDLRILVNHREGSSNKLTYNSKTVNEEYPLESWLQLGGYTLKMIGKEGIVDLLRLSEYDPITHGYNSEFHIIDSMDVDDEWIHYTTKDGKRYCEKLDDDEECDEYRVEPYDPSRKTEHFLNECLRRGASLDEVMFLIDKPVELTMICPYHLDWDTGRQVQSGDFVEIGNLADRLGIGVKFPYFVPKPRPGSWSIYPDFAKHYCKRAEGCEQKKDDCGCIWCPRFLYNMKPVKPEHQNSPNNKKIKCNLGLADPCDYSYDCEEEDCE